jgi:hypothetical protein
MDENQLNEDIIVMDEDTPEDEDGGGLYPYDPTKEDIDIREDPQTVFELIRKYKQGKLIIDPDFQRNLVWGIEQKSRFIESVILNFPLPPLYVNQSKDGKYIIVDGLQRTTTLYQFMEDPKFELKGLKALPHLNGYTFDSLAELEGDYQAKIEDKKLTLYTIRPSVSSKVVYDIFNRINTGGTQLNQQEIRNCIFSGKSTKLLKELSELDIFKQAIDYGISPKRMKDREVILRYLAFQIFDYKTDYEGDMSLFRIGPQDFYLRTSLTDFPNVGAKGENTINLLDKMRDNLVNENLCLGEDAHTLITQTQEWLHYIFDGAKLEIPKVTISVLEPLFNTSLTRDRFKASNIGFGYSYILPIVVSGLIAKNGEILIVENPEAHLHPKAQSRLIKFLTKVSQLGVQIIIESHSDHILNALRIAVLDKVISPQQANILYFPQEIGQPIVQIDIQEDGRIEKWPDGFFDQMDKDFERLFGV